MAVAGTNIRIANGKHDMSSDETAIVVECDDGPTGNECSRIYSGRQ